MTAPPNPPPTLPPLLRHSLRTPRPSGGGGGGVSSESPGVRKLCAQIRDPNLTGRASTDQPLFLLNVPFLSLERSYWIRGGGGCAGPRGGGGGGAAGDLRDFKDIDRHSSIVGERVIHLAILLSPLTPA
uniref:Uncharacterized protein n=1 Tax=Knipowitschia caucasica TaxID=637954 RepID=A0AAV2MA57_KNICA